MPVNWSISLASEAHPTAGLEWLYSSLCHIVSASVSSSLRSKGHVGGDEWCAFSGLCLSLLFQPFCRGSSVEQTLPTLHVLTTTRQGPSSLRDVSFWCFGLKFPSLFFLLPILVQKFYIKFII